MGKNRDRISIIADVLKAAGDGTNKTKIMFAANLSYKLLEKYLTAVMTVGFIQPFGSYYRLTEAGRLFLERYEHFYGEYSRVEKTLKRLADERSRLEKLCDDKSVDLVEQ